MCDSNDCDKPATHRGFWPGRPPMFWCDGCKDRGLDIASAMGLHLHTEPYTPPQESDDEKTERA